MLQGEQTGNGTLNGSQGALNHLEIYRYLTTAVHNENRSAVINLVMAN